MKAFQLWIAFMIGAVVGSTILFFGGHPRSAQALSIFASSSVFLLAGYVVLFDPMNRWPGRSLADRLARLLTFNRSNR